MSHSNSKKDPKDSRAISLSFSFSGKYPNFVKKSAEAPRDEDFAYSYTESDVRLQSLMLSNKEFENDETTQVQPSNISYSETKHRKGMDIGNKLTIVDETTPLTHENPNDVSSQGINIIENPVITEQLKKSILSKHVVDGSSSVNKKSRGVYRTPKTSNPEANLKKLNIYKKLIKNFGNKEFWRDQSKNAILSIPAVIVGIMLTILDGVSYGLLIFPTNMKYFSSFGQDGISMFFLSTFIAQFVYSLGGSGFKSANGGFMIEVVPFLHTMCRMTYQELYKNNEDMIVPTILIAFAFSSVVTGIVFLLMGYYKLGIIMEYFPRHILIGCIGGVGMFLFITGIELTTGVPMAFNLKFLKALFQLQHFFKWNTGLLLAIGVRVLALKFKNPLFTPMYFISIAIVFYLIVAVFQLDLNTLRSMNWLFQIPKPMKPFYDIYLQFSLSKTDFYMVLKLFPVMLSLTFFGILHVPINVPSLAVSINETKINVNQELLSHGVSNILSGLCGSVQNYLIYSNSVIFIKSGGTTRVSGIMLALATVALFIVGPNIIGFIPLPLVGSLVFHMGIDLIKEAIYDTYNVVHLFEYLTISIIVVSMTFLGFVEGIFLGIAVACVFFVMLYSNKSPIRAFFSGRNNRSLVRRLFYQRKYLENVGEQIQGISLQGFLFFGSIHRIDYAIKDVLKPSINNENNDFSPVKYVILNFKLVSGIDFSAADAFTRIYKRLAENKTYLVICGITQGSEISKALTKSGILYSLQKEKQITYTRCFETLNLALEWCENELLSVFYAHRNLKAVQNNNTNNSQPLIRNLTNVSIDSTEMLSTSPRKTHLIEQAKNLIAEQSSYKNISHPAFNIICQAMQDVHEIDIDLVEYLSSFFERIEYKENTLLWDFGDDSTHLLILEHGNVQLIRMDSKLTETILPGTIFGDGSFLTKNKRRSKATTTYCTTIWRFSKETYEKLQKSKNLKDVTVLVILLKMSLIYSIHDKRLLVNQLNS